MTITTSRGLGLAIGLIATMGVSVSAQAPPDGSGLLLGPLSLRPVFVLREAGVDSNVFNLSGEDSEDRTAMVAGTTDARMRVGNVQIDGRGGAEYLYFERYTQERALNRFGTVRVSPQLLRFRPFVSGGYKRTRDRANSEIDVRVPRTEHEYIGGVEAQLTPRATLQGSWRRTSWRFDEGERFRDIDLAARLNRHTDRTEAALRYELSPLTSFTASVALLRERFVAANEFDADSLQSEAGLLFAPDAVIRGRAVVGFRDSRPKGAQSVPSRGPTAGVELSYTLLDRTVITGRFGREWTVSAESHPYFLLMTTGVEVTHNLVGPLDLIVRGATERLDYQELPAFNLPAHLDRVQTLGGGLALRLGSRVRIGANYEDVRRRSNALYARDYDRRRLYTTVSYGF